MCIKKRNCEKMAVLLKESQNQFYPYMYCLYLKLKKTRFIGLLITYKVKILTGPSVYPKLIDTLLNVALSNHSFQNY